VIWQLTADYVIKNAVMLPSFTAVLESFCSLWDDMISDAGVSLLHFGIGMAAGMCVAIPLGVAMGWFRVIDRIFDPIIEILRPIPPLAWIVHRGCIPDPDQHLSGI
jgi:NitT/TauT family transport system permease protein